MNDNELEQKLEHVTNGRATWMKAAVTAGNNYRAAQKEVNRLAADTVLLQQEIVALRTALANYREFFRAMDDGDFVWQRKQDLLEDMPSNPVSDEDHAAIKHWGEYSALVDVLREDQRENAPQESTNEQPSTH